MSTMNVKEWVECRGRERRTQDDIWETTRGPPPITMETGQAPG